MAVQHPCGATRALQSCPFTGLEWKVLFKYNVETSPNSGIDKLGLHWAKLK